ncbi:hypothetical protein CPB86DRAFT_871531 [Serendipita vermifera]|nr:hypothetical protein CPB86DRAFT_871531 [Serendipita vermifera]
MDQPRLRDKYPLAFRPPSPPLPSRWQDMDDDEIIALEIPGVDRNVPPTLHADQIDMQICEKLREIDNNMAAIHSVLAYKIVPGLKEYARVTEPMREVSRFWISMFEAACAPKEEPEPVPHEEEESGTPQTATSTSHMESQERISTEESSYREFQDEANESAGLVTSTPIAHRASGDVSISSIMESPHERLKREVANFQMDGSMEISESSNDPAPVSSSNISTSPLASFSVASGNSFNMKGKTRPISQDLRTKAIKNMTQASLQKPSGSVFREMPSNSSINTSLFSDTSMKSEVKAKPTSIFNPAPPAASRNVLPIFTRVQQQVFGPSTGGTSTGSNIQQLMIQRLLKEAAYDKKAGIAAGAQSPGRSPARFNALRGMAVAAADEISISTDEDTISTAFGHGQTDVYGNEVLGGPRYEPEDSFDDSDEDDDEEEIGQHQHHFDLQQNLANDYDDSFDSAGWQPRPDMSNTHEQHTGGTATQTLFGVAGGMNAGGRNFQLQNGIREYELDSFAVESPILARRSEPRSQ